MSKHNNVNPAHYKVGGRERPGDDVPAPERAKGTGADPAASIEARERWEKQQQEKAARGQDPTESE